MTGTSRTARKRARTIIAAVLIVFALSFIGSDYYLRGHLYYTKRVVNLVVRNTWQALFPPSGPVGLYVRVVADQDYRRIHPDWETHILSLMDQADERFAAEFQIRFKTLGISAWERPDDLTDYPTILTSAAKKINRHGANIVVIMTGKDEGPPSESRWLDIGIAHNLGNCVVVGEDGLLLHELGHLFGAVDYPPGSPDFDTETMYSYKYAGRTDAIDPANRARILKNKYRVLW